MYLQNQVKRFYFLLILLVFIGWAMVIINHFFLIENYHEGINFCLFKTVTGYPCPACGVGRGIDFLVKFQILHAFLQNPFSFIVVLAGLVIPFWILLDFIKKDQSLYGFNVKSGLWLRRNPFVIALLIVIVLGNWYWNIKKL